MTTEAEVPMSVDYFILSLMRVDRDHYQRVAAVKSVTGDEMESALPLSSVRPLRTSALAGPLQRYVLGPLAWPGYRFG